MTEVTAELTQPELRIVTAMLAEAINKGASTITLSQDTGDGRYVLYDEMTADKPAAKMWEPILFALRLLEYHADHHEGKGLVAQLWRSEECVINLQRSPGPPLETISAMLATVDQAIVLLRRMPRNAASAAGEKRSRWLKLLDHILDASVSDAEVYGELSDVYHNDHPPMGAMIFLLHKLHEHRPALCESLWANAGE